MIGYKVFFPSRFCENILNIELYINIYFKSLLNRIFANNFFRRCPSYRVHSFLLNFFKNFFLLRIFWNIKMKNCPKKHAQIFDGKIDTYVFSLETFNGIFSILFNEKWKGLKKPSKYLTRTTGLKGTIQNVRGLEWTPIQRGII